jgi:hypothetical protein
MLRQMKDLVLWDKCFGDCYMGQCHAQDAIYMALLVKLANSFFVEEIYDVVVKRNGTPISKDNMKDGLDDAKAFAELVIVEDILKRYSEETESVEEKPVDNLLR